MTDYGHDLRFGTFLTPAGHDPDRTVDLAVHTERAGLDLVTFQDHPYQPAFLDTWTLLSWVAARTERVHLSGNVLNVPLRHPAVLARAAASLDLLSKGRVDLALGAGTFWTAIEAMGTPPLSPGDSVTALSEAIDVIRALWDTAQRGGARTTGEFHHVTGAKRGPAPAHDIPIWLGAYKPRMLRLVGEKADGLLVSQDYLRTPLHETNAIVDEAARAHDRDPREIRRLLNISPPQDTRTWAERLVPLALEDGVGTFILASDDPHTIETFGKEVAPAVRAEVEVHR